MTVANVPANLHYAIKMWVIARSIPDTRSLPVVFKIVKQLQLVKCWMEETLLIGGGRKDKSVNGVCVCN